MPPVNIYHKVFEYEAYLNEKFPSIYYQLITYHFKNKTVFVKRTQRQHVASSISRTAMRECQELWEARNPNIAEFVGVSLTPENVFIATVYYSKRSLQVIFRGMQHTFSQLPGSTQNNDSCEHKHIFPHRIYCVTAKSSWI